VVVRLIANCIFEEENRTDMVESQRDLQFNLTEQRFSIVSNRKTKVAFVKNERVNCTANPRIILCEVQITVV
jgi:hypothetical protein